MTQRVWVTFGLVCMIWNFQSHFLTEIAWAESSGDTGWEEVVRERGITVSKREKADQVLPIFRGMGTVKGTISELLAFFRNIERHREWIYRCSSSELLKQSSESDHLIYYRLDAPWPIWDRDVVIRSHTTVFAEKKQVMIRFASFNTPLKKSVENVVRMPRLRGYYRFNGLDQNKSRVEFYVDADPGGALPPWLAARVTRDLPLNTLKNLREQMLKRNNRNKISLKILMKNHPTYYLNS